MTIEQTDLLGEPTITVEVPPKEKATVVWLVNVAFIPTDDVKDIYLQRLGITRRDGEKHLAAWKRAMMERTGMDEGEFRRHIDWEANIFGNRGLANFIWALA